QVRTTLALLDEGATVPFIARYRKELTGSLDEVQIVRIRDRMQQLRELDKRRETILHTLTESGKLTAELEQQLRAAETMSVLEDLYLPYRPKRKTRASVAREKGLQPLADWLLLQEPGQPEIEAGAFLNPETGVADVQEALAGARDILAEQFAEHAGLRALIRDIYLNKGELMAKVVP